MTKILKKRKYLILFFFLGFVVTLIYLYGMNELQDQKAISSAKSGLLVLSENELKNYNGEDTKKPIYIGLDGYVYDVTSGRKFYEPGGSYHSLAGKDSTNELKIFGGGIIKRKYPIVAILKK